MPNMPCHVAGLWIGLLMEEYARRGFNDNLIGTSLMHPQQMTLQMLATLQSSSFGQASSRHERHLQ
jgi:hypothetical protein